MADRHAEDRNEDRDLLAIFGERLRRAVAAAGCPNETTDRARHQWLADRLGYTAAGVRRWFVGDSIPSPAMLKRLCRVLDVSLDYLFAIEAGQAIESVSSGQVRCVAVRPDATASVAGVPVEDLQIATRLSASQSDHPLTGCWLVQAWSDGGILQWRRGDWLVVNTNPNEFREACDALVVNSDGIASFRIVSTTTTGRVIVETAARRYKEEFRSADVAMGQSWPLRSAERGIAIVGSVVAALP